MRALANTQPCVVCGNPALCCIGGKKHINCQGPQLCDGCKWAKQVAAKKGTKR